MYSKVTSLYGQFILIIYGLVYWTNALETAFTVEVAAGRRDCFHQPFSLGSEFEIDYQVIEGGDMDINFYIQSPSGRVMVTEIRKQDGLHKLDAIEEGDYGICFDNSFSRFSSKYVFFEILSDVKDPFVDQYNIGDMAEQFQAEYEMKLQDILDVFDGMKQRFDKSRSHQQSLRIQEVRDRSIQESNFIRVNFWSGVQLTIMVLVCLTQVMMIRSLFEDHSKLGKLLKAKT